ncbi:RDD family protein [Pseudarthrobacter phenanthrenivorans]|uniref:RDD family protein n=1 Tax=Pseudarthrobacter phenanthrenivorans TaxID=361575 RepID=A0A3B0FZ08_PSEPS|nr:RDD family protein [Pseudarthrobacter phenanthrenivorans]RKO24918.1 RDD family protein [Pseudarthrobacter phenanthrenivorans]
MGSIVTGEAVVLELRPASFAARALGLFLDVAFHAVLLVAILIGLAAAGEDLDEAASRALVLAAVVFCLVIVPVAVETLSRGLSLGKLAAGLRVVREDGGAIRFRHAVIRGLTGFLEIYLTFGGLAIAVALFNDRSRRLGDLMAGTYAIRTRVPVEQPVPVFIPPGLRAWAAAVDIGRVPDATARRASQFLRQAGRMAPLSRSGMSASIATELSAYVAPPPPPGTGPEDYLAAVVAERRTRELARLSRSRSRNTEVGERLQRLPFSG